MVQSAQWPSWQQDTGTDSYRIRELLRAILDLHGYYGDPITWLWRGQADSSYLLSPGVHTRVIKAGADLTDENIGTMTESLLSAARAARLDTHEGAALPDFALLARLQHHGAATPLLDVSLDPLVALYMAVVSPNGADDGEDGVIFAIKKPSASSASLIEPFDTRNFSAIYNGLADDSIAFYRAPDVSDRLRIQRGYFLISKANTSDSRATINLSVESGLAADPPWIVKRLAARGKKGRIPKATSDIAAFRVPSKFKHTLKSWLEERTGLTEDFVYPTVWHQPHQEAFARSHRRHSPS